MRAGPGGLQELWTARLTVRDVLLCRDDPRLEVVATSSGRYDARLSVALAGRLVEFPRAFVSADLAVEGAEVRVVGTHLDSLDPAVALAQARELVTGPAGRSGAVVVLGDLNSDPCDEATAAAYRHMLTHGFTDCWPAWSPDQPGFTCGLGELLDDETPAGLDRRLDVVLARSGTEAPIRVTGAWLTGVDMADRDPATGLWASDHAGVVATLWL
ncbi:MAG TPA: endonuclease/exonuclease/phosphatase family protein [Candidatus Lustribacter sp.]|nr:endonuclease/exonuclease/phosphatase family protein [Candidatus Lustribacter sp.]